MITKILYFILEMAVIFGLSFAWSSNRKGIRYQYLVIILIVQFAIAIFMLESSIGVRLVGYISDAFNDLLGYSHDGTAFVFGDLTNTKKYGFVFFFNVAMPIILVSTIIGVLQYFKILPLIIKAVGFILSKITGMGRLESFNAVSSLAVGQSENFINYKNIIGNLPSNVLYTMAATAMSTISMSIAGSYMAIINPKYVCVAIIVNMFGTFFVLTIINPYKKSQDIDLDKLQENPKQKQGFFEMLAEYILDGFKVAITITAMLIGFIGFLSFVDGVFHGLFGITFRDILGYVFYPFAWILNIHGSETLLAGKIMGTKVFTNEFIAMQMLAANSKELSQHAQAVISVFLVSFANIGSIGIILGAIQALNKEASIKVAKFSLKILYGATLVSFLSASIVGLIV